MVKRTIDYMTSDDVIAPFITVPEDISEFYLGWCSGCNWGEGGAYTIMTAYTFLGTLVDYIKYRDKDADVNKVTDQYWAHLGGPEVVVLLEP